jgi:hypothetical protein
MRMLTEGETRQGAGCAFGSFDAAQHDRVLDQ